MSTHPTTDTPRGEAAGSGAGPAGPGPGSGGIGTGPGGSGTGPGAARRGPDGLPAHLQHFIDGRLRDSAAGGVFEVLDPVSNQVYATAAAGQAEDVDAAVAAAARAFAEGPWPRMAARARARVLNRVADLVEARDARLAELETFDTGLPITQALGQAQRAAENFRFFADVIVAQADHAYQVPGRQLNYVNRRPVGVAGLITPWNTPFMLESWKLAPALAAGCTVVLKPAEFTPLSASLWAEIFTEAGLPEGVFNLVHGIGEEAGAALVAHPGTRLISFTGETTTGQIIFREAATHLKGLSMELGGKSPVVVFADADLDSAIDSALFGVFSLNGERCTAGSRILVQREVYDGFVERFAARARDIVVGDPADPRTEVGALVHPEHYARVMDYVEIGRGEGRLVAGGARPPHLPEGNYLAPTVFADVPPTARIFQEEIFGPVVAITPFADEDEALRLANGVRYGLAAYVWTADLTRGHRMAHAIEAGMVWLNSHNVRDLRTPFGGVKASGLGHEGGHRSIDFYTEEQAVHVTLGPVHPPRFGARAARAADS
ncbi:MAG TPA: 5-carboxymethyl-2-hydroxymuconate semialdehyde dehydrogenase [Pilimelia sp.]|nr:5-carboxymethyl-2-hydroxymuconate semialdehyde dehydrogenase [Pilimelia sp.]